MNPTKTHRGLAEMPCPGSDELQLYLVGKVDEPTQRSYAEHVETCDACQEAVATLSIAEDPLVVALCDTSAEPLETDASYAAGMTRVIEIGQQLAAVRGGCRDTGLEPTLPFAQLGNYQLQERLGRGGMGQVFRALHMVVENNVALKVLPTEWMFHPQCVARFHREIKAGGKLVHPNVVRVLDAGVDHKVQYLVMELVDGVDLVRLLLERRWLRVVDTCELVRQAALGLAHLHEQGLVHRDIKPSNLMLQRDGTVKVLDLGIALLEEPPQEELTRANIVIGTADYTAPEQAERSQQVDSRSDIYSLGCTLYKLLTGDAPFARSANKVAAHAQLEPTPLSRFRDDIPEALVSVLAKLLAKDPNGRPADCHEVARLLEPLASNADLVSLLKAAPPEPAAQSVKQPAATKPPANWKGWALLATAALLVLFGIVVTIRDKTGKVIGLFRVPAGSTVSVENEVSDSGAEVGDSDVDATTSQIFAEHDGEVWCGAVVSADQVVTGDRDGWLMLWDVGRRELIRRFSKHGTGVVSLCVSPDGKSVLTGEEGDVGEISAINVWDLQTGQRVQRFDGQLGGVRDLVFLPDGKRFVSCARDKFVCVWNLNTFEREKAMDGHEGGVYGLAVVPDGRRVVSVSYDGTARVWDVETGQPLLTFSGHQQPVFCVVVTNDGRFALTGGDDHLIRMWDLHTAQQEGVFEGHTDSVRDVALSADGRWLFSASVDTTVRVWEVVSRKEVGRFLGHTHVIRCVTPLPDGRRLLSTSVDTTCRIWDLNDVIPP